jgi:hypothetical protein
VKKAIFFDIDGTLLGSRGRNEYFVPAGAMEAVARARDNGHLVAICSGRQERFIQKMFHGFFSSYIAMNGTHVVVEGKTVLQRFFPLQKILGIMRHFDPYGASYNFVGNEHGWGRNLSREAVDMLDRVYNLDDYVVTEWKPEEVRAGAIDFVFRDHDHYERCRPAFTGNMVLNLHPSGLSGDLSFPEHDKASAIRVFCRYAGIDLADTVAFGDGYNDVTMLKTAGIGVAMGNGVPPAKDAADLITDGICENGIENGLRRLGLI